jgi:hypothetical protein
MSTIPRESVELVGPITAQVTENGVTTQADPATFTVAVVPRGSRPATWAAPTVVGGKAYVLVGPGQLDLIPGRYDVWLRYTDTPETVVVLAGTFYVT